MRRGDVLQELKHEQQSLLEEQQSFERRLRWLVHENQRATSAASGPATPATPLKTVYPAAAYAGGNGTRGPTAPIVLLGTDSVDAQLWALRLCVRGGENFAGARLWAIQRWRASVLVANAQHAATMAARKDLVVILRRAALRACLSRPSASRAALAVERWQGAVFHMQATERLQNLIQSVRVLGLRSALHGGNRDQLGRALVRWQASITAIMERRTSVQLALSQRTSVLLSCVEGLRSAVLARALSQWRLISRAVDTYGLADSVMVDLRWNALRHHLRHMNAGLLRDALRLWQEALSAMQAQADADEARTQERGDALVQAALQIEGWALASAMGQWRRAVDGLASAAGAKGRALELALRGRGLDLGALQTALVNWAAATRDRTVRGLVTSGLEREGALTELEESLASLRQLCSLTLYSLASEADGARAVQTSAEAETSIAARKVASAEGECTRLRTRVEGLARELGDQRRAAALAAKTIARDKSQESRLASDFAPPGPTRAEALLQREVLDLRARCHGLQRLVGMGEAGDAAFGAGRDAGAQPSLRRPFPGAAPEEVVAKAMRTEVRALEAAMVQNRVAASRQERAALASAQAERLDGRVGALEAKCDELSAEVVRRSTRAATLEEENARLRKQLRRAEHDMQRALADARENHAAERGRWQEYLHLGMAARPSIREGRPGRSLVPPPPPPRPGSAADGVQAGVRR